MTDLTPAQRIAMLANSSEDEPPKEPTLKTVSIRFPFDLLAEIDALNSVTGIQSRNAMVISLLRAGVYSVVQELDDPDPYQAALEHYNDQYQVNQEQE